MPNTRTAKKRNRQAQNARARNRAQRSALRAAIKKVREAESQQEAVERLREATALLDRAARKNLVPPNAAARHKSRLSAVVKQK